MNCEGCMFQRYVITSEGQKWYCRRESSDDKPILHSEEANKEKCKYGF